MKGQELQESTATKSPYPPFSAFCDFLKREARIACNPVTKTRAEEEAKWVETSQQRLVKFGNRKKEPLGANSLATGSEEVSSGNEGERKQPERCRLCKNTHNLNECDKFKKMLHTERIEFVKSNGLCLGCLKYGHMKKDLPREEGLLGLQRFPSNVLTHKRTETRRKTRNVSEELIRGSHVTSRKHSRA